MSKDPIAAADQEKRAAQQDEKARRDLQRIEHEAASNTTEAKKRLAAQIEADTAGGNLTERVVREHLEGHLVNQLGMDPAKAKDLARMRAAQMVGKDT